MGLEYLPIYTLAGNFRGQAYMECFGFERAFSGEPPATDRHVNAAERTLVDLQGLVFCRALSKMVFV